MWSGDLSQALLFKHDVLRMMRKQFNLRYYVYAYVFSAWAEALIGRWESAIEDGREALRAAEKASDKSLMSFSGWFLSGVHTLKGDLPQALEHARKAEQEAPTLADKTWTQAALAWAMCHSGAPGKGTELLETTLPLFRAGRYMPALLQSMLILAEGYLLAGRYDDARELLAETLETSRICEARGYLAWGCRILGEVNLQTDLPSAGHFLEQSVYLFEAMGADNELAKSWAAYGRYLAYSGKVAQAKEVLRKALATFERLGTLIGPDNVKEALAQLPESG